MIDGEPLKRGADDGRRPDKPVPRNLEAGCRRVPVIAGLPAALKRRIAGVEEPATGKSRSTLMDSQEQISELASTLRDAFHPDTLADAVRRLAAIGTDEALHVLWEHRSHSMLETRRCIVRHIGKFERSYVVSFLEECLTHDDEFVRANAVSALADVSDRSRLRSKEIISRAAELLRDPSQGVRIAALRLAPCLADETIKSSVLCIYDRKCSETHDASYYVQAHLAGEHVSRDRAAKELADLEELWAATEAFAAIFGKEQAVERALRASVEHERRDLETVKTQHRLNLEAWRVRVASSPTRIETAIERLAKSSGRENNTDSTENALCSLSHSYFDVYIIPWLARNMAEEDYLAGKPLIIPVGQLNWVFSYEEHSFETWWSLAQEIRVRFRNPNAARIINLMTHVMLTHSHWRSRWYAAAALRRLKDEAALSGLGEALADSEADVRDEAQNAIDEISNAPLVDLSGANTLSHAPEASPVLRRRRGRKRRRDIYSLMVVAFSATLLMYFARHSYVLLYGGNVSEELAHEAITDLVVWVPLGATGVFLVLLLGYFWLMGRSQAATVSERHGAASDAFAFKRGSNHLSAIIPSRLATCNFFFTIPKVKGWKRSTACFPSSVR